MDLHIPDPASCTRCERKFVSPAVKTHHTWYSKRHHVCVFCGFKADFRTRHELNKHLNENHYSCGPCGIWFKTSSEFEEHDTKEHNRCGHCDRYFGTENGLRMHKRTHDLRDLKCYGCPRVFPSFSAMLIHLEAGNCASGVDISEIDMLGDICYQSRKYKTPPGSACRYSCPRCRRDYRLLSGLFQHAETTPACRSLTVKPNALGKLQDFIAKRV